MKYVSQRILKPLEFVPQKVSSHEYGSAAIKIGEQIQIEEHIIEKLQKDQIDPTLKLQQQEHTQITSYL